MLSIKHFTHVFFIIAITLGLLFGAILLFSRDFIAPINNFFVYRTGE